MVLSILCRKTANLASSSKPEGVDFEAEESPMTIHTSPVSDYTLDDRYALGRGRVFMTGTQALVRGPVRPGAARPGRRAGTPAGSCRAIAVRRSAVSTWSCGARRSGSTKGRIEFLPAVNEDLAATAVLGATGGNQTDCRTSMACSASGTARARASTGPAMR
jgi:hypothetical protein